MIKEKALGEDLEVPVNIHRWRKLKATNPDSFEKIAKIQSLSRRLIAKSEEVNATKSLRKGQDDPRFYFREKRRKSCTWS